MQLPHLTLVLGGAASGKSDFAERLVAGTERPRLYIATAQAFDREMEEKIALHRQARGTGWRTIETPLNVAEALDQAESADVVLLDCATFWLTNHLLHDSDLAAQETLFQAALNRAPGPGVVVTNEVGQGIVPENPMARRFRNAQGRLNQRLAAQADLVVQVIAGLPLVLKGTLPEGMM